MRRLALLLCAFALAFPACGEDDEAGGQAEPAATATPTEEKGDRGGYGY
jgi:hypothetical protein